MLTNSRIKEFCWESQSFPSTPVRRCANGLHMSAMWKYAVLVQWIRCEPLGKHIIHWTSAAYPHIAQQMNNVCIFSHEEVMHYITVIHCNFNYSNIDIRIIVKTTARSVRTWASSTQTVILQVMASISPRGSSSKHVMLFHTLQKMPVLRWLYVGETSPTRGQR